MDVSARPGRARLRVALDATPLLGLPTGVGAFCQGVLSALATRPGLSVRGYAVSWRRRSGIEAHLPLGVASRQRPMPARPLHAAWAHTTVPPLEWFVGTVDVVHGTNFVVPPTRRAKTVMSVHDLTPLHHPEMCDEATLAYPDLIRRALRRGAWVHTDSAFVAGEVSEAFGVELDRVRVVHPGIPELPTVDAAAMSLVLKRVLPPGTTRYVLAVGTAEPRKDLPGLVRAFAEVAAHHDDVALVLAGPTGWGEQALTDTIARSPARERVVRTGWVTPEELGGLVDQADVLAYPSLYEGFGFPPLQAMRAGVPVIATRAGSLPEVLGDGVLFVDAADKDELSGALDRCLTDQELRGRLVAAGVRRAESFSWDACANGLELLYQDMAGRRGG